MTNELADLAQGLSSARKEVGQLREEIARVGAIVEAGTQAVRVIEAERITLRPDDVLVINVPDHYSQADLDAVASSVQIALGTHRILITSGATSIHVAEIPEDDSIVQPPDPDRPTSGGNG